MPITPSTYLSSTSSLLPLYSTTTIPLLSYLIFQPRKRITVHRAFRLLKDSHSYKTHPSEQLIFWFVGQNWVKCEEIWEEGRLLTKKETFRRPVLGKKSPKETWVSFRRLIVNTVTCVSRYLVTQSTWEEFQLWQLGILANFHLWVRI